MSTTTNDPIGGAEIRVEHLTKHFGGVAAVDDLSFTVAPATVTGFLGRNGAGKTTTLRCLLGLSDPTAGTASFDGVAYRDLASPASTVGAVLESTSLHPGRRAVDHLRIMTAAASIPDRRVDEVLDMVGLGAAARQRIGTYSLGMRQRLGLAGALLGEPRVLILDEPTNGLDPEGIKWLRTFLRRRAESGTTVLLSSHQLAEITQTVDHVVIIDAGRHVASGTIAEITRNMRAGVRVRTPMGDELVGLLTAAGYRLERESREVVRVDDASVECIGPHIAAARIVVYELTTIDTDLEGAFFQLTDYDENGTRR